MVTELRWLDLDPATHAFVPRAGEADVTAIVARVGHTNRSRANAEAAIERALVAAHGAWAAGFRWGPSSSGPVRGWCCASHSVVPERDPDRAATVERVFAALAAWREVLEELAGRFAVMHAAGTTIEEAAAQLLPMIVEATGCEEAWYHAFSTIVAWYAEPLVGDVGKMRSEVEVLVQGRFASWSAPPDDVARDTFARMALMIEQTPPRDALEAWLAVRERAFAEPLEGLPKPPVEGDGHARYIEERDRVRDPVRADRMLLALELCRGSAGSGMALSVGQLAEWQALVMGAAQPVALRTGDAFAKGGRERYPMRGDLHDLAERLLAESADPALPPAVRAARAYLDVCFVHPFPDGNARAARLALDHVLTSAGLALRAAGPVFTLSRAATDGAGAASFARVIDRLAGPR